MMDSTENPLSWWYFCCSQMTITMFSSSIYYFLLKWQQDKRDRAKEIVWNYIISALRWGFYTVLHWFYGVDLLVFVFCFEICLFSWLEMNEDIIITVSFDIIWCSFPFGLNKWGFTWVQNEFVIMGINDQPMPHSKGWLEAGMFGQTYLQSLRQLFYIQNIQMVACLGPC